MVDGDTVDDGETQHQAVFLLISFMQNRDNHNCFHHPNTNLAGQWWEFTETKNAKCPEHSWTQKTLNKWQLIIMLF